MMLLLKIVCLSFLGVYMREAVRKHVRGEILEKMVSGFLVSGSSGGDAASYVTCTP